MSTESTNHAPIKLIGAVSGPAILLLFTITDPASGLSQEAWYTAGVAIWMAIWWSTEAIPVPATALLPLAVLPILGVYDITTVADSYTSSVVYLLLGGFIVALGLQRWDLHKRIALAVLTRVGDSPAALIGGFMAATALLSMWVSNTAATLMMLPIAMSVAGVITSTQSHSDGRAEANFSIGLVLAIAYSASIGGLGTMIGSPPNLLVVGFLRDDYGVDISFVQWAKIGIPFVLIFLPIVWFVLTRFVFSFDLPRSGAAARLIRDTRAEMGSLGPPQKRMAAVFSVVAAAWMLRPLLQEHMGLPGLSDTGIAVIGALLVFVVPSGEGGMLMNWDAAKKLPWDVLLLYGGGMALSGAIASTGLAIWLGEHLSPFATWHLLVFIAIVVATMIYLTEIMNNSAAVATFLPIIAVLALSSGIEPHMLAVPAALAASCAFMFPVATPPNAIVYGSGQVTLPQMVRAGFRLNLLGVIVVPVLSYFLLPIIFT
jgi:sodium-dependent dicarboxylate transporter 2/3/5